MHIKSLSLGSNNIGDPGARALAEMLKVNTTLNTLELSGNVIDYDVGAPPPPPNPSLFLLFSRRRVLIRSDLFDKRCRSVGLLFILRSEHIKTDNNESGM
jgi:hypothetical protein